MPHLWASTDVKDSVASFRFDDDFEMLTEEKKATYLEEIARALGLETLDVRAFRKGSVIVDINLDKEQAARVAREAPLISESLGAEVKVAGADPTYLGDNTYHIHDYRYDARSYRAVPQEGDEREALEIVLKSGDHVETDRGLFALAQVSGTVFHDHNANGIQDINVEEGIEGIRVLFVRGNGDLIGETFTGRDGKYQFAEKEPGDYYVSLQFNSGYMLAPLPDPAVLSDYQRRAVPIRAHVVKSDFEPPRGGNSSLFALHSGSRTSELNAALYRPATIRGFVWEDMKGDGHFDRSRLADERPLGNNAMVDLILLTDPELPVVATLSLIANAPFVFDTVMPGTYKLKYSLPSDHYFVLSSLEQNAFVVGSGNTYDTKVGFYRPITISGSIYEDLNAVGYITGKASEARRHIRGAHVELIAETPEAQVNNRYLQEHRRAITASSIISPNGEFKFEGFAPGVYHLRFTPPEGYKRSKKLSAVELMHIRADDPEALGSDADQATGVTPSLLIESGALFKKSAEPFDQEITVCMYTVATLGGYVWEDRNADGIFDDDERALPHVEVRLSNADHSFSLTALTNERGHYLFRNLEPGRYLNPVIVPPTNHQLSNARITFKYVDATDRRLAD